MTPGVEIIVGTYEEFLLGYKLDTKNGKEVLVQSFADKSHTGALKCLAVQGDLVATGATDDRVFIYDMRTRKQSQILLSHEGTINALAFTPDKTHLLSGGEDGHMIATRTNTWNIEANWKKAHNGSPVTHISCHPSGKMALSLGGDLVLRTWNLVKGRVAYKTNLKSKGTLGPMPDCLAWSPTGDYFTLGGQRVVEFWSIKSADVVRSQKTASKPVSVCWVADETCLVGMENGKIQFVNLEAAEEEQENIIEAHNARVKTMCYLNDVLVTASSAGEVKMWKLSESNARLKKVAAINIGCRPTCIGLLDLGQFAENYGLAKTAVTEQKNEKPSTFKKSKPQEKGVVTVEYEEEDGSTESDDSENDAAVLSETGDSENEADSVAGEDDEESEDSKDNSEQDSSDEAAATAPILPQIPTRQSGQKRSQVVNKAKLAKRTKLQNSSPKQQKAGPNSGAAPKSKQTRQLKGKKK